MTREQQISLMRAGYVLRALRSEGDMRVLLNWMADELNRAGVNQQRAVARSIMRDISALRDDLEREGGLDSLVLSSSLSGVNELILSGV